uniref:RRM domain-containing protein n=1 Tax=Oryza glumipatula TaxID=40148 RepID=A0A0D9Z025_9ORYZ
MANSSCLSTSPAALRLARPKLPDSAMIMQLQLQLQHAPLFPRPPAARAHHHHHQRRLLLAVSDHVAAKPVAVPVGRMRMRAATAMVSQEEAAATAVEEQQEEEVEEEQLQEEDGAAVQKEEQGGVLEGSSGGGEAEAEAEAAGITTKLYFGNLPYNCDSAQLAGIVQDYATPEMVEVLYDRATGRSRGFAFVTMSTIEDCEQVIKNLDGSLYSGRTMRVNFADKPKPKLPLYPETEHKLFVGNLSWTVTSEMLTEMFQKCGNVVGARVLYDGETGRSRGYGFVCYSTKEEMDEALSSLNGTELEGREIRVNLALGKK